MVASSIRHWARRKALAGWAIVGATRDNITSLPQFSRDRSRPQSAGIPALTVTTVRLAVAIEDATTAFYQPHKALGSHKDATRSINIDKAGYSGTKYLLCLSTEKLEGEPWAGVSLANGDLVNLQIKNAGGVGFQYAVLEHEIVLCLGEVNEILQ